MEHNAVVCEQYTRTALCGWTDGPKYVFDTICFTFEGDCEYTVLTVQPGQLESYLQHFAPRSVATIYFIDDRPSAERAKTLRPDLDVRLLVI